jgi:FG-GAP-like repeat
MCKPVFAALMLLLLSCGANAQTQSIFVQPPAYNISFPNATADLNGDGKSDLIGLDGTILLGNADGTLHSGTPWCNSSQPFCTNSGVFVEDLNNDGKPDLLVPTPGFLWILLGNGDGTFQSAVSVGTGANSVVVQVADINGDSKLDVLLQAGSSILIFLGNGDGTFQTPVTGPTLAGNFTLIGAADFTGDGNVDLLAVFALGNSAPQVSVIPGNGNGTFQSTAITTTTTAPATATGASAVIRDVNGDHKLDVILVFNAGAQVPVASLSLTLLGNGDGTFTSGQIISGPGTAALIDLNGDGIADLATGTGPFAQIFLGKADGTFDLKGSYFTGVFSSVLNVPVVVGDFNGDGKPDVVAGGVLLLGNGDGTLRGNDATLTNASFLTGDFNGDNKLDFVAVKADTSFDIFVGDGTGKFPTSVPNPPVQTGANIQPLDFKVVDVNADNKLDLLFVTADTTNNHWTLNVLLGNGNGTFAAPTVATQGTFAYQLSVVGDFNQDHKLDFAVLDSSGAISVFLGNGDGTFHSSQSFFAATNAEGLVAVDFNNDGKLDLIFSSPNGENICLGKGDGTFGPAAIFYGPFGPVGAVADLNGDGVPDLVIEGLVLLGNGDGTAHPVPLASPNASYVLAADINGDGKVDLIGFNGLLPGQLQYVLGNGDGTFGSPVALETGLTHFVSVSAPLSGDFNGDNKPDLLFGFAGGVVSMLNIAAMPPADFLLRASVPSPLVVAPGSSATSIVTLTAIGSFSGSAALSCSGLPTGATCNFSPASITGGGSSSLSITTTAAAAVGTYPVAVVATSGAVTHNIGLSLAVATSAGATTAVLSPNIVNFGVQAMGSSSIPQTVQLTNTGSAALSIASAGISVSGSNAGDFSISNNTCGSSLAPATSCVLSIIFTPGGSGSRSASLMVSDNATASPQFASLSGSAPGFSVAPTSPATVTVAAGKTATYTLSVAPSAGFTGNVSFTCTGAPALAKCTVAPASVTLGAAPSTVTVSVSTTAATQGFAPPIAKLVLPPVRPMILLTLVMLTAAMLVLLLRQSRVRFAHAIPLALVVAGALAFGACGGSGGSTSTTGGGGGSPGTPSGTSTITVAATSGSGSSATTHNTTLTLTVQ